MQWLNFTRNWRPENRERSGRQDCLCPYALPESAPVSEPMIQAPSVCWANMPSTTRAPCPVRALGNKRGRTRGIAHAIANAIQPGFVAGHGFTAGTIAGRLVSRKVHNSPWEARSFTRLYKNSCSSKNAFTATRSSRPCQRMSSTSSNRPETP